MTREDRLLLIEIKRRAKVGEPLTPGEFRFCQRMLEEHPQAYKDVDREVVERSTSPMNPLHQGKVNEPIRSKKPSGGQRHRREDTGDGE